ncbi:MAG: hypothetical protein LAP21_26455 [Acidobacteriia bacterium]|nr:hypothetical protein [Terriglobia bacterium]
MNMGHPKACLAVVFMAGLFTSLTAQQTPAAAASPAEESSASALPPTSDAREIVRRSVEIDHHNFERARNYTARQREVEKHLDKHGQVKLTEIKTWDITFLSGEPYSRLIEKDDKPLSEKDQQKEEEKMEKFIAKHRDESEHEREKRQAKEEKERQEGRLFLRDVVNAFDFRLAGEEQIDGHGVYIIEATPRKDFHPTQPHADLLAKVQGRLWIEKDDYNWVKAGIETIDTISFGLFLARIHKGSRLEFEQTRVNNEIWLMRRVAINASARLALLKNEAVDQEDIFSNYRKFTTGTRILGVQEVENH